MPRRHRDASAMRPSTDSYANDIMRRFQFREPGTGSATGSGSGAVQGGSSWLTLIWQNFCMSFCHFVIIRREGDEGWEEWGREEHQIEPASASWNAAKFCHFRSECGSGIMCHGSVRMQRRDTFGGIWRGMRHKTRRRGSSFFFSRFLHSHVICRLPANYLAIILEKISGRRAGGAARERLGRSADRQNWRPPS